ncbi:hypothetical protein LWX53_05845 [bacterium]|nr:hypothetical protein [bacterium]
MKEKRYALAAALLALALCAAFAQGQDPKTVTPAWIMERDFTKQDAEKQKNAFGVFFFGYDYPTLSGALAGDLSKWNGPFNVAIGMENCLGPGSSSIFGLELELMLTFNDSGSRFLMNDMMLVGYSLDLAPARLNLGARLGLCMLDVTAGAEMYTGLGGVVGPEATLYLALDKASWLWIRGRYSMSAYFSLDSGSNPINSGRTTLNATSLEAGLAFKI